MLKAVLETDVIAASILSARGNKYRLRKAWEGRQFQPVLSESMLEKVVKALNHRSLKKRRGITDQDVWGIEDVLKRDAIIVKDDTKAEDVFVACARAAQAGYIVRDIRPSKDLNYVAGIRVMNPGEFLRLLERRRRMLGTQKTEPSTRR